MTVSLADIAAAAGGTVVPADAAQVTPGGIAFDSRSVAPGDLFAALSGSRTDGHEYVASAFSAGAAAALVQQTPSDPGVLDSGPPDTGPLVLVADSGRALVAVAGALHRRLTAAGTRTIAVTGSNGKTTTKDLLAHVLRTVSGDPAGVVAPPGSYNNDLGLPVTVIGAALSGAPVGHLVLEMGARGPGHIAQLCRIAPPDIGIVLTVGSAHLAEFGSREALARAKAELPRALPATGVCVLNADDPAVAAMASVTAARVVTVGTSTGVDVLAADLAADDAARAGFTLSFGGAAARVSLRLPGLHQVTNALAAAAVALVEGYPVAVVAEALSTPAPISPHRMAVTERPDGITVVDDAYNANPESMAAALRSLAVLGRGRRTWAVLGEMLELGDDAMVEHDAIGRLAVRLNIGRLIAVGAAARALHLGAIQEGSWGGESQWVPDAAAALAVLDGELSEGDVVLLKASNSIGLWRLAGDVASGAAVAPRRARVAAPGGPS